MTLKKYIEENPKDILVIGKNTDRKFYIRPINWAGEYIKDKEKLILFSGNCLAYFDNLQDAEQSLIELNFKNYKINERMIF